MPSVKLNENVRHNQNDYGINEVIHDLSEKEAQRLVKLGAGYIVGESGNPLLNENNEKNIPPIDPPELTQEETDLREDLKAQFEYSELKKAAKEELGLEFQGNISHEKLISLIIESGKANDLFEEDGE